VKYQLFYQQHLIATVEEDDADFPSFFGRYQLEPSADAPELAHVRAYLDYSVRVWPLIEQDRFDDPAMSEEEAYTDLIDSRTGGSSRPSHRSVFRFSFLCFVQTTKLTGAWPPDP
jgi:hypothetical protein